MKKSLVPILLVAGITALSGCANNGDNARNNIRTTDVKDNARNNIRTMDVRDNVRNNVGLRGNNRLTVSERAARNVERLTEVDRAHVIMRDNNAYVAVRLRDRTGSAGTTGTGTNNTIGNNRGNNGNGNAGTTGITSIGGTTAGMNGIGRTGVTGNRGGDDTGNRIINGNPGTTSITGAGNNFGTTGTGNGGNNNGTYSRVDTAFEQRVADQVRKANPNVHSVYVSKDANFFNQMTTYSNDIRSGRNSDGLFRNFTDTVRDIFDNR